MSVPPSATPAADTEHAPVDTMVEQGRITGSYGVRGWVKVEPFNAESRLLMQCRRWWVRPSPNEPLQPWRIVQARPQGSAVVAEVEHLTQREAAAAFKGARVLVARQDFPEPEAGEFYWVDLIGCLVQGEGDAGQPVALGRVVHVSDNGAHGVLHVQATPIDHDAMPPSGDHHPVPSSAKPRAENREHLIPFVAAHVLQVDLAQRLILSNWPESF